jgi:phosphoribosylglycinamide formyltransferase-1
MSQFPKLAVLVSGKGSNLQSIIDHVEAGKLKAQICIVISDKTDANALKIAQAANLRTSVVKPQDFQNKDDFDRELLTQIDSAGGQWIVLAGFMRILGKDFLARFTHKIMNIHPSLLPSYPGLKAIQKAFQNKEKVTGVTVHYVDEGVDTGQIIAQEKVPITDQDTLETLEKKIHQVEHQIYPKAIQKVLWDE